MRGFKHGVCFINIVNNFNNIIFFEFNEKKWHIIPKLTGYNEASAKRKIHSTKCPGKETGEILHWQLNSTTESSRAKGSKLTQEEQMARSSQTPDWNQPNKHVPLELFSQIV